MVWIIEEFNGDYWEEDMRWKDDEEADAREEYAALLDGKENKYLRLVKR